MTLKFTRLYRCAKTGELVQCMETGNIWSVYHVYDNGEVIVDEKFDSLTGDVKLTTLEPYSYWIIEKVPNRIKI